MNEPKRRETRRTYLDASAVPVERALLARADELAGGAGIERVTAEFRRQVRVHGGKVTDRAVAAALAAVTAAEFRTLAEELHWW